MTESPAPRPEFLVAPSLWWDGRLRSGSALRLSGGQATVVPVGEIPPGARRRSFPGTLLPGLVDAHVHSGLVDLAVLRAGGISAVWDLGSEPGRVAELARRAEDAWGWRGVSGRRSDEAASGRRTDVANSASRVDVADLGRRPGNSALDRRADDSSSRRVDLSRRQARVVDAGEVERPGAAADDFTSQRLVDFSALGADDSASARREELSAHRSDDPAPALRGSGSGAKLPRIRYAGPFLTAPGGYPSDRAWAAPGSWRAIESADQAVDAVGAAKAAGASLVKVTAHAGGPRLPLSTLTVLVDAAHDAGLPVVVHAEGAGTVVEAYESGADILAHTPWTEPLDPGLVRACAQRMRWISTLDIHGWGVPTPEQTTAIANLRRFLEYGGSVRYGTDLGNGPLPLAVNPREIRALQSAGLTPDEILMTMTDDGVTWIPGGLDLEPTRFADVLATARVLDDDVRPRLGVGEP